MIFNTSNLNKIKAKLLQTALKQKQWKKFKQNV